MKIYIASSWSNPFLDEIVSILNDQNHQVHDFRANGGNRLGGPDGSLDSVMSYLASAIHPNQLPAPVRGPGRSRSPALRPALRPLRPRGNRHGSRPLDPGRAGPRRHRAGLDAPWAWTPWSAWIRRGNSLHANSRMTWRMHWPWPGIPRLRGRTWYGNYLEYTIAVSNPPVAAAGTRREFPARRFGRRQPGNCYAINPPSGDQGSGTGA